MSIKPQMPLQTFADFWRNTEKSEAAMSLLWSAEVFVILDSNSKDWIDYALKFNFKWVLFLKCSFTWIVMVWSDERSSCSSSILMAGVATEKPGPIFILQGVCSLPQSLIGLKSTLNTIYLFSETRRGYREADVSEGSFKRIWLLNLEFLLTWPFFSVFAWCSRVLYRKALVRLKMKVPLAVVNDYLFYFWTVDYIFKWIGFEIPFKMSGAIL